MTRDYYGYGYVGTTYTLQPGKDHGGHKAPTKRVPAPPGADVPPPQYSWQQPTIEVPNPEFERWKQWLEVGSALPSVPLRF